MPLIPIARLMIAVAVVGIGLGLVLNYTSLVVGISLLLPAAFLGWLSAWGRPTFAPWGFALSAAWLNLSLAAQYAWYPVLHNEMGYFFFTVLFVGIVPGVGVAWSRMSPRPRRAAFLAIVLTAIPISMLATRWPYHLGVRLSSPALDRLADHIEAGGAVTPGEWGGLYPVRGSARNPTETILIIDPSPSGMFAFFRRMGEWDVIDQD